jgi:hypothetical protein
MPYNRPYPGGFVDFPSTSTPIDASALNTMDVGIKTSNDQFQTVTTAQRATLTPTVGQAVWDSDLKQLMVFMNAAGGNAWQPVGNRIVCASTTRPSSPFEGQEIYETDTQKTLVYSGSAWVETSDLDYSPSATVCTSGTRPATGLFEGQRIYETDTNREFTYSGSGWVQTNQWSTTSGVTGVNNLIVPPVVFVSRVANQSIANNTDVAISWDTQIIDNDDMWASGTNITVQTAGVYSVSLFVNYGLNSSVGVRENYIKKNGTTQTTCTYMPNASFSHNTALSGLVNCAANDVITLNAYQNYGGAMNITGHAELVWIGRTS